MSENILVTSLDEAKRFIIDCFKSVGTCQEHAEIIADNLVEGDYRGHYSHGMNRLNWYISDITHEILDSNALPTIEKETVATALVDGNNGLGAVVGKFCMDLAIEKAKEVGIGMVTAHHSNHYGIAGIYVLQAIKQNCLGFSCTNTSPILVPTRAKEAILGSNPISFGVPGIDNDNFVLDMATTVVAAGKLEVKMRHNEPLPNGWALNEEGQVERDAFKALNAHRLLPIGGEESTGGYKGYGLSMMVEILCGILGDANYGPNVPRWSVDGRKEVANLGHCFIAIDPSVFAAGYSNRLKDLTDYIRHTEPSHPDKPVLIPGDPELIHMQQVQKQGGICYSQNQLDTNYQLSQKLKVTPMKSSVKKND